MRNIDNRTAGKCARRRAIPLKASRYFTQARTRCFRFREMQDRGDSHMKLLGSFYIPPSGGGRVRRCRHTTPEFIGNGPQLRQVLHGYSGSETVADLARERTFAGMAVFTMTTRTADESASLPFLHISARRFQSSEWTAVKQILAIRHGAVVIPWSGTITRQYKF